MTDTDRRAVRAVVAKCRLVTASSPTIHTNASAQAYATSVIVWEAVDEDDDDPATAAGFVQRKLQKM